ncbi:MAG: biotin transporter BioY [Clostridia bacterium]|nr:biotin transporter BioY [Clostridia bacterium]
MKKTTANVKFLTRVALSTALMSVSAMIVIPSTFVPFSLQVFALYFILFVFGGGVGIAASVTYAALGFVGLPIFSGFSGGIGKFFEPSGAFIIGFIVAALVYFLFERFFLKGKRSSVSTFLSLLALYLTAAAWIYVILGGGGLKAFLLIFPYFILSFVIPDLFKIAFAEVLAVRLGKYINKL